MNSKQTTAFTGDNTQKAIEDSVASRSDGQRTGVMKDIEATLGMVPGFFRAMPETHIAAEWKMFKEFQLSDRTALPPKMKELIGLASAATLHCQYCTLFHTVAAGMNGATPQEISETLLMAKQTAGWSAYLHGTRYDIEQLRREMREMQRHMETMPRRSADPEATRRP